MRWLNLYKTEIKNKEVIVCKKINLAIKKIDYLREKYIFSQSHADYAIEFVEKFCRHYKGEWARKPIILSLWQKVIMEAVFGLIDEEGCRVIREVFTVVGRKNGKSTWLAALQLYMFIADSEHGAEIYSVANKLDQAKIIYKSAFEMVKKSNALTEMVRKTRVSLEFGSNVLMPLASDSDNLDGLDPHFAVYDEGHAAKNNDLYDVISTAFGARKQPLFWHITTAGTRRNGLYDYLYEVAENTLNGISQDDSFLAFIYELDDEKEINNSEMWIKANPNLGKSLGKKYIETQVGKAKASIESKSGILTKHFNMPQSISKAFFELADVKNTLKFKIKEMEGRYCIVGIDLGSTTDLTCITFMFPFAEDEKYYIWQKYFIPEKKLEEKIKEDKMPYKVWVEKGLIDVCPGNKINQEQAYKLVGEIVEKYDLYIQGIGVDGWQIAEIGRKLEEDGYNVVEIRQGAKTLSSPMKNLEAEFKDKNIIHNNNPIFVWNTVNVGVMRDVNDNIRPVKGNGSRGRIDGFMSFLDAYTCYLNLEDSKKNIFKEYQKSFKKEGGKNIGNNSAN